MKKIFAENIHTPSDKLEVFLFNVGQGDHIMLKFPTMEYGIIDFHYETSTGLSEAPCLSYFKELKKVLPESEFKKITISFFCISHTDKDHVKGMNETMKWFRDERVFIRDIWLGAAKDKLQLPNLLRERINRLISESNLQDSISYVPRLTEFEKGVQRFFDSFEQWRRREFESERYRTDPVLGSGEYLVDIKPLPRPCSQDNFHAINIGPLMTHLDGYFVDLFSAPIEEILDVKSKKGVDKNRISHILKIKFGEVNSLFGGDTDKKIWVECLAKYARDGFEEIFGNLDSHFIKVSHHGSKNSSSKKIWSQIIPESGTAWLGIAAGRHKKYKHPSSETLQHIRALKRNAKILSTNICGKCVDDGSYETEHHVWYDDFVRRNRKNYGKDSPNENDNIIVQRIGETTSQKDKEESQSSKMGLFAYIFEIPGKLEEEIKIRVAVSNANKPEDCFFTSHTEKLFKFCG